jgi:16S rRNA (guanine966-N2)-methyltransferase
MYMRIISGIRRGHKLHEFQGKDIRPTTDRVKEALFNLIQAYVPQARVLDMFAGSGALSFEAISRGASFAVLVDSDKRSVELIKKNIDELKFHDMCKVMEESCFSFAENCTDKFDIIFLDPPYNKGFIEPALSTIVKNKLLSENGIIVLESDSTDFKSEFKDIEMIKQKRYGRTFITIYESALNGE